MLGLRAAIVQKNGLPWLKAAIFGALKEPSAMDAGMKVAAALEGLVFREPSRLRAISPRSPFAILGKDAGLDEDRLFPAPDHQPSARPRSGDASRVTEPADCGWHFSRAARSTTSIPRPAPDLIEVLTANHVEVVVPKEQQCCGTPVLVHGDRETARTLARNNLDAMERSGAEYIVTGCGSCGGAWQHEFPEMLQRRSRATREKAAYWSARTYDISTFLTKIDRVPRCRAARWMRW